MHAQLPKLTRCCTKSCHTTNTRLPYLWQAAFFIRASKTQNAAKKPAAHREDGPATEKRVSAAAGTFRFDMNDYGEIKRGIEVRSPHTLCGPSVDPPLTSADPGRIHSDCRQLSPWLKGLPRHWLPPRHRSLSLNTPSDPSESAPGPSSYRASWRTGSDLVNRACTLH